MILKLLFRMVHIYSKRWRYLLCPARRDAGDLCMAIGTAWCRLFPWERWMWWTLSTVAGSDPAAKLRVRAKIHTARWDSEAECRFRGSVTGPTGANCDLRLRNIFLSGQMKLQAKLAVSLRASYFSPCKNSLCPGTLAQIQEKRV